MFEEKILWISVYRQSHPMPNGPGQSSEREVRKDKVGGVKLAGDAES